MKLSELYSEYFANWISDGSMISRDKISLLGIRPLFDRYLTSKWITRAWIVTGLPVHYDECLIQKIRTEMFEKFPEVKTIVHMYNTPINVRVNSDTFKRQLHSAANKYQQYEEIFQSLSEDERATGVQGRDSATGAKVSMNSSTLKGIQDVYDSYMYVYESANGGKEFYNTYFFIHASGLGRGAMQRYDKTLIKMLSGDGIIVRRVQGNVGIYLENFCPASFKQADSKKFATMLFSQENIAALLPNKTKGLVGSEGIMLGMNWQTKLPFMIDFTGSETAQVVVIEGKSGCGKTFLGNEIVCELTAFGVHCSVTDIKGGEWGKLSDSVPMMEIDMSGPGARFVNLMRIDNLQCDIGNCIEAFEAAVGSTVGLFEIATNLQPNEGNKVDLRSILNQAVEKVYSTSGVIKTNPDTFENTKNFKYEMVLDVLTSLEHSKSYTDNYRELCKLIRSRCAPYFQGEGRYSSAFQNELTVAAILDTPLIVYNFNKNRGESLDTIDDIRVFMARCLDSRKHFLRKQKGLHQAVFYEELQRCGGMTTLIENISTDVTGSRSNNLSVFLLLNAVSTFDAQNFAAIKSNITTMIVGNSNTSDIKKLVTEYDCGPIEDYMQLIHNNVTGELSHCFAVMYDTGNDKDTLILKTVLPERMSKDLSTRDILKLGQ